MDVKFLYLVLALFSKSVVLPLIFQNSDDLEMMLLDIASLENKLEVLNNDNEVDKLLTEVDWLLKFGNGAMHSHKFMKIPLTRMGQQVIPVDSSLIEARNK